MNNLWKKYEKKYCKHFDEIWQKWLIYRHFRKEVTIGLEIYC